MRINVPRHLATRDPFVYTVAMDTVHRWDEPIKRVFFLLVTAGLSIF